MILGINVVGAVQGYGSDSSIIVSAHYDHIGKGHSPLAFSLTKKTDSIYNGANDNGTGTAAMMELAKYFAATKRNYYTIIFIAFSGEELGMKGSNHFAKFIDNPSMVKAVINLEMLGRPFRKNSAFYTGAAAPKIIRGINSAIADKTGTKEFLYEDPFEKQMLYRRSDHYSFVNIIDQSFTIMASSPEDAYYHSIYDETKTIDFDFLLFAVKNIAMAVEYLAN